MQLASRGNENSGMVNRIALKCDTIGIDTAKNVLAFPVPGSGFLTGESQAVGIDLGMATKSIQLDGIITEQMVQKNFETKAFGGGSKDNQRDGKLTADTDFSHGRASGTAPTNSTGYVSVKMTPHEIAQLIHSHVDSSIIQPHQNLNELVFLIPSFVNYDYHYQGSCDISTYTSKRSCEENDGTWTPIAASAGAVTALEPADGKLVPFNWGVRHYGAGGNELDNKYTIINTSKYPKPYVADGDVSGVKGFVRSFNTSFSEQPYITFSMTFEVAITGL